MYRPPYHIRKSINEELERLETLDIIDKDEGPHDWVSNVVATPKSNGKVRLNLDARIINKATKRHMSNPNIRTSAKKSFRK